MTKVPLDKNGDQEKYFLLGNQLSDLEKKQLTDFLLKNKNIFAWSLDEMSGVSLDIICHKLNADSKHKPVIQKDKSRGIRTSTFTAAIEIESDETEMAW